MHVAVLRRSGQVAAGYRKGDTHQQDESMSNRIDRDVINALIAGSFRGSLFRAWHAPHRAGLEVRALLPDATEVWVIEPKPGVSRQLGRLDSRGFFNGLLPRRKTLSLPAGRHGTDSKPD